VKSLPFVPFHALLLGVFAEGCLPGATLHIGDVIFASDASTGRFSYDNRTGPGFCTAADPVCTPVSIVDWVLIVNRTSGPPEVFTWDPGDPSTTIGPGVYAPLSWIVSLDPEIESFDFTGRPTPEEFEMYGGPSSPSPISQMVFSSNVQFTNVRLRPPRDRPFVVMLPAPVTGVRGPEPHPVLLMLGGVGAIWFARRRLRRST
jgi:hypothetical protein